jgi:hypothetical protein
MNTTITTTTPFPGRTSLNELSLSLSVLRESLVAMLDEDASADELQRMASDAMDSLDDCGDHLAEARRRARDAVRRRHASALPSADRTPSGR